MSAGTSTKWRSGAVALAGCAAVAAVAVVGDATAASAASGRAHQASASHRSAASHHHARAHHHHNRFAIAGSVTAVSDSAITVEGAHDKSRTYAVNDATTVRDRNGDTTTIASVSVGDHVSVRATSSSTSSALVAKSVSIRPDRVNGTVTAVDGNSYTVTDRLGTSHTVVTSSDTTFKLNGKSATSDALVAGRKACASGTLESDGTTLDAAKVSVSTKSAGRHHSRR